MHNDLWGLASHIQMYANGKISDYRSDTKQKPQKRNFFIPRSRHLKFFDNFHEFIEKINKNLYNWVELQRNAAFTVPISHVLFYFSLIHSGRNFFMFTSPDIAAKRPAPFLMHIFLAAVTACSKLSTWFAQFFFFTFFECERKLFSAPAVVCEILEKISWKEKQRWIFSEAERFSYLKFCYHVLRHCHL